MKKLKAAEFARLVNAFFMDGNTPIGQMRDGSEVVLTSAQVKAVKTLMGVR